MDTIPQAIAAALHLLVSLDPALLSVVGRSLAVSTSACLIAFGFGVLFWAWLGVSFAGRGAVLAVLNTLLALPSVVVGLLVYLLLSRSGPLALWAGCIPSGRWSWLRRSWWRRSSWR
jgi:tungstate transport system permease protein